MKRNISLSIFFPSYNEEDNIGASVRAADAVARQITDTYEIIVVDDGSRDKTGAMADRMMRENPRVRVVHHRPNQGYGAAVLSGIKAARYDYIFFTDADLQFDLTEIEKLTDYVPEYPIVLGYRSPRRDPFIRLVNAWGWNKLNRLLFGLKVKDIDCAFKLMRRDVVQNLPIKSKSAMMSAELLVRLMRKGVPFKEVPVAHLPRTAGVATGAKPAVIARAFKSMIDLYRHELGDASRFELARFGAVGIANTAIDLGAYFILTRLIPFFGAFLGIAKAISYALGAAFSFSTNRSWTFRKSGAVDSGEIMRFAATAGSSLVINTLTLFIVHGLLGVHDLIAALVATVAAFAWNFSLSRSWVFKTTKPALTRAA